MVREAALMLVDILFNIYIFVMLLRFFLQLVRADFYNPLTQLIFKLALPVVWPLQKVLPPWRNISFAALLGVFILEVLKIIVFFSIGTFRLPHVLGAIIWGAGDMINHVASLFFFVILLQAILSWIRPQGANPVIEILYRLSALLLRPFQRIIPPIGGFDLSPIPVLIILRMISYFVAVPIMAKGLGMA
ncbi:MAG: YggT family protein [Gammaproteobacteria bacterium]